MIFLLFLVLSGVMALEGASVVNPAGPVGPLGPVRFVQQQYQGGQFEYSQKVKHDLQRGRNPGDVARILHVGSADIELRIAQSGSQLSASEWMLAYKRSEQAAYLFWFSSIVLILSALVFKMLSALRPKGSRGSARQEPLSLRQERAKRANQGIILGELEERVYPTNFGQEQIAAA